MHTVVLATMNFELLSFTRFGTMGALNLKVGHMNWPKPFGIVWHYMLLRLVIAY